MAKDNILRFADQADAGSVLSDADYLADEQRRIGHQPGVARAPLANKAMKGASAMASGLARFIAKRQGKDIDDGLTTGDIESYMKNAIDNEIQSRFSALFPGAFDDRFPGKFDNRFPGQFDSRFPGKFDRRLDDQFPNKFDSRFTPRFNQKFPGAFDGRFPNAFDRRFDNAFEQAAIARDKRTWRVGSLYMNAQDNTNPAEFMGFGRWSLYGRGRVLVGQDSSDGDFNRAGETGGEKRHRLSNAEMPRHSHEYLQYGSGYGAQGAYNEDNGTHKQTSAEGGNQSHNNLQPYITVYIWRRTA